MEYVKDEIFEIRYNENLNCLEFGNKSWTSKILKKIKNHKLLTLIVTLICIFSILDIALILQFMSILQNG